MHRKVIPWLVAAVAAYAGWRIGAPLGLSTAFILAIAGAAVGIHYGRVWVTENL